jgi:hypothetical protein
MHARACILWESSRATREGRDASSRRVARRLINDGEWHACSIMHPGGKVAGQFINDGGHACSGIARREQQTGL